MEAKSVKSTVGQIGLGGRASNNDYHIPVRELGSTILDSKRLKQGSPNHHEIVHGVRVERTSGHIQNHHPRLAKKKNQANVNAWQMGGDWVNRAHIP